MHRADDEQLATVQPVLGLAERVAQPSRGGGSAAQFVNVLQELPLIHCHSPFPVVAGLGAVLPIVPALM